MQVTRKYYKTARVDAFGHMVRQMMATNVEFEFHIKWRVADIPPASGTRLYIGERLSSLYTTSRACQATPRLGHGYSCAV